PAGKVVGLVGPNGAGKTTLLHLAVGLLAPSAGAISVLGRPPAAGLGRVGFVAQETPVYARLSVAKHLRMGAYLNPGWDAALPAHQEVVMESHTDKQTTLLVRTDEPIVDPAWTVRPVSLDDLVIAYLSRSREPTARRRSPLGARR